MKSYKTDFPIFLEKNRNKPLVYLDHAATSQKPYCVLDAISHYYSHQNANIHRGIYELSEKSTALYEAAREAVCQFIQANDVKEIIFTSGTTESINLVAQCFGQTILQANDEIILTEMEHHSNIVPWQMLCDKIGSKIKSIPVLPTGELDLAHFKSLFTPQTKLIALSHCSNVLGTINPIKEMIAIAHQHDVPVLIDGAQAFSHLPINVQALDCDFYVFSAHKAYGPTGVGVLYGKQKWLEYMPPYRGGGDMIEKVSFQKTTYAGLPHKFEAGTPNIANVIGFHAALQYLQSIGMDTVFQHNQALLHYATDALEKIPGVKIIGQASNKIGVLSFTMEGIHPHDIAAVLDYQGIAVRAGHHCAMPLMDKLGLSACVRASFGIYNTMEEVDQFVQGILSVKQFFNRALCN